MKSKETEQLDPELEEDEDDVDVDDGGPSIAAAKKSKITIIAASSVLITLVLYFFFFKGDDSGQENLVPIAPPPPRAIAPAEDGRSPFEIDTEPQKNAEEEIDLLAKPAVPEVPTLPELPEDAFKDGNPLVGADQNQAAQPKNPFAPKQILPTQQFSGQQQVNEQGQINQANQGQIAPGQQNVVSQTEERKIELNPRYSPIIVFSVTASGTPARGVGYENNIVDLNKDPIDELKKAEPGVEASYIADRVHTIAQGKMLTAVLETAINTEIPGLVRAVVSRDVYGEAGTEVLIPRGSRLFGSYSSEVDRGQGRVEIAWTRLIRPDGVDLTITFAAADQFGRAGIEGDVDNKYGSLIANSLLTSVLAVAGVAAAETLLDDNNNTQNTTTVDPTTGTTTTTGTASNQAIYDVSKTIIDTVGQVIADQVNTVPVIRVPQGTRITVIVNADIKVPSMKQN